MTTEAKEAAMPAEDVEERVILAARMLYQARSTPFTSDSTLAEFSQQLDEAVAEYESTQKHVVTTSFDFEKLNEEVARYMREEAPLLIEKWRSYCAKALGGDEGLRVEYDGSVWRFFYRGIGVLQYSQEPRAGADALIVRVMSQRKFDERRGAKP